MFYCIFQIEQYTAALGAVTLAWTLISISGGTTPHHSNSGIASVSRALVTRDVVATAGNISSSVTIEMETLHSADNSHSPLPISEKPIPAPLDLLTSTAMPNVSYAVPPLSPPGSAHPGSLVGNIKQRLSRTAAVGSKSLMYARFRVEIIDTGI